MKECKIIAIHRPTGEHHELGKASTVEDAIYTLDNEIYFDTTDNPSEWAFQVVDEQNYIVAYGNTLNTVARVPKIHLPMDK